jgi:hypothetical protein
MVKVDGAITLLNIRVGAGADVQLTASAEAEEAAKLCIAQHKPPTFYSQATKRPRRGRSARWVHVHTRHPRLCDFSHGSLAP